MQKFQNHFGVLALLAAACVLIASGCGGGTSRAEKKYLGDWVQVDSSHRFAKIYRDGDALIWEDNEGKYPARMNEGQMIVSAGMFGDVAVQYVPSSDHLIAAGNEYKRKTEK